MGAESKLRPLNSAAPLYRNKAKLESDLDGLKKKQSEQGRQLEQARSQGLEQGLEGEALRSIVK